ncbi:MAG: cobalamin-dependent protein [Chloroflexota bacterium]|nr:cobalamin-dependent protein [Chloroflexota bacterium]
MSGLEAELDTYVESLVRPDTRAARAVVEDLVGRGESVRAIYLDVLEPALVEVGRRWQRAAITVAHEHLATATTKAIMARLSPLVGEPPPIGRRIVLACTPGELHGVGARMVADFLEGDGWEVLELGADTPTADLLAIVASERPDVVGLSTALSHHLGEATSAVAQLKALDPTPFVLVGGAAYADIPDAAAHVGADASATNAGEASALLRAQFGA